ncbi:MAG: 5-(carboxyamino)imidazole ribonucleotide synthase, partial [Pseudomonadota bacterium]
IAQIEALAERPYAVVHDYGKSERRPGRKMGHVTFLTKISG